MRRLETMLGLSRGTRPPTGLTVSAHLLDGVGEKGTKVTDAVLKTLNMTRHASGPHGTIRVVPVWTRHPLHE